MYVTTKGKIATSIPISRYENAHSEKDDKKIAQTSASLLNNPKRDIVLFNLPCASALMIPETISKIIKPPATKYSSIFNFFTPL